jgi:hypothetical protein
MTDTDLRTAAAAFEADLSEYCDGPLRDALRAALAQSEHNKKVDDWGATLPPQSDDPCPTCGQTIYTMVPDTDPAEDQDSGPVEGDGPALDTWTQEEMDAADHTAKERFEKLRPIFEADNGPVESGPALKCPNPDCRDGLIQVILYDGTPDVETCWVQRKSPQKP